MLSKYEQIIKEIFETNFTEDDIIDALYWIKIDHNQTISMIRDCENSEKLKELIEKQKLLENLETKFTEILSKTQTKGKK